ncbi:unnamed protein product [Calypogeia fissa]
MWGRLLCFLRKSDDRPAPSAMLPIRQLNWLQVDDVRWARIAHRSLKLRADCMFEKAFPHQKSTRSSSRPILKPILLYEAELDSFGPIEALDHSLVGSQSLKN